MRVWACLVMLLLPGCSVGPDYHRPVFGFMPTHFLGGGSQAATVIQPRTPWWYAFHDAQLDALVVSALTHNTDLKIAKARLEEAKGARINTIGGLFPQIDARTGIQQNRRANDTTITTSHTFNGSFDASWEIDVFGGGRRAAQAATANVQAREANINDVRTSMVAEVVRAYLDYQRLQNQLDLTHTNLQAQQETLAVVHAQYAEGVADLLDVSRIETQTLTTQAAIPTLNTNLATVRGSLSVLTGLNTVSTSAILVSGSLPVVSDSVTLGLPASVIAGRPDVQSAERELAAAVANQGVAISNWFPRISLSSLLGFETTKATGALDVLSTGGTIRLPLLDFGRVRGLVKQADARQKIALATYERSILAALADVETSFTSYKESKNRLVLMQGAALSATQAEEIARAQYKEGLNSLLDVLVAQQRRLEAESTLAESKAQVGQSFAALHKALGL